MAGLATHVSLAPLCHRTSLDQLLTVQLPAGRSRRDLLQTPRSPPATPSRPHQGCHLSCHPLQYPLQCPDRALQVQDPPRWSPRRRCTPNAQGRARPRWPPQFELGQLREWRRLRKRTMEQLLIFEFPSRSARHVTQSVSCMRALLTSFAVHGERSRSSHGGESVQEHERRRRVPCHDGHARPLHQHHRSHVGRRQGREGHRNRHHRLV